MPGSSENYYGVSVSPKYIYGKTGCKWPRAVYYDKRDGMVHIINEQGLYTIGSPGALTGDEERRAREQELGYV